MSAIARDALENARDWLVAEADDPRPDPAPAMRLLVAQLNRALAILDGSDRLRCAECGAQSITPHETHRHFAPPEPCPVASSITGQPCLLPAGHPQDSAERFHRYAAAGFRDTTLEALLRMAAGTGEEATAAELHLWADVERYIKTRLIDPGLIDADLALIAGNIRGFWGWWLEENRAALAAMASSSAPDDFPPEEPETLEKWRSAAKFWMDEYRKVAGAGGSAQTGRGDDSVVPAPGPSEHWNPGDSAAMKELWARSDHADRTLLTDLADEMRFVLAAADGSVEGSPIDRDGYRLDRTGRDPRLREAIATLPEMVGETNSGGWSLVRRIDVLAALAGELHPGEPHDFRATCQRCGVPGVVHVAVIGYDEVFRVQNRAELESVS